MDHEITDPNLPASIIGHDGEEQDCGVQVIDQNEIEHILTIGWDGTLRAHEQHAYPNDEEKRTEEEQLVMDQVRARGRYVAQREFPEQDILSFEWYPPDMERAVRAVETCEPDRFEEYFRDLYEAVQNPPVDAPIDNVEIISQSFTVTDDDGIDYVSPVLVGVEDETGNFEMRGPEGTFDSDAIIWLPMYEIEWGFGEPFRDFLVHHLKCQIRDCYFHMGEEPPEAYRLQGYGKYGFNGAEHYEDVRSID